MWDYTSGSFRQARGWELCGYAKPSIVLVGQLLLSDTACIAEYAEGGVLTVYMLRREIADPSDYDTLKSHLLFGTQTDSGFGRCCREGYI